ncbi:MAG: hypothetical protein WCD38_12370 [Candidatus Tumulicola sp.]
MIAVRGVLAVAMTVVGAIVVVRVAALGFHAESLPGFVLGLAMIALGVHRLSLIARTRRGPAQ